MFYDYKKLSFPLQSSNKQPQRSLIKQKTNSNPQATQQLLQNEYTAFQIPLPLLDIDIRSQPLKLQQQNQQIFQNDIQSSYKFINMKKINQLEQQQKQIQKVAEELIVLKDIVKKLKISLGILVEDQMATYNQQDDDEYYHNNDDSYGFIKNAVKKLQQISDKRITPEYKQWILQYFNKIYNDIKQIKSQFEKYQKAKFKTQFNFDLIQSKITYQSQKSYQSLIQYQIKSNLLKSIIKLCKSKGIFTISDSIKYTQQISTIKNSSLIENLQKYKMSSISQKVKQIKKSSPQEMFYQWKSIHDQMEIINLQQIQRFYQEKKILSYTNNYKNNQNGILILGGCGVGKTTLFLSMAGEKMVKRKIKSRKFQFENYQAADQQICSRYKTSPFSLSCTRQPAKLQAPKKYTFPQQLCLIDTAGFQDNRSIQIDIMNTLYTYQTIQQMKKLRIIIVLSQKSIGERDQGLYKFARHIAKYFRDYEEVRESVLFVLTKFENVKRLKIACDNILKSSGHLKQTNEYKFIKHLQESIIYKECVQFKPTDQNIVFDTEYIIDPVQMDSKLKKLYKNLLKRFPIHHQYQNDYINLQYSRQTRDKLIQKKCYLQNMIYKLYKQGNNNFRFYLQQLLFLQSKINKIQTQNKGKYQLDNRQSFEILNFIDQINQEVLVKFNKLIQKYFETCDEQILKQILQVKEKYSNLYLANIDGIGNIIQLEQTLEEDSEYVFQEINDGVSNLKSQFNKVIQEKYKVINKTLKNKTKWCFDIKNNKWLCAVINFVKQLFKKKQYSKNQKIQINKKKNSLTTNKQYKSLIKTLKKNQLKFKQSFLQQINSIDQQIMIFLTKKNFQPNSHKQFTQKIQKKLQDTIKNFKNLVFHNQILIYDKKSNQLKTIIPSQQKIYQNNLEYIISIIKQNFTKQFQDICHNIEFMNLINHNLKDSDSDISMNVFEEVQRYLKKIKIYYKSHREVFEMMQQFQKTILGKVHNIVKQINQKIQSITIQQNNEFTNNKNHQLQSNSLKPQPYLIPILQPICTLKLPSNTLYCFLSKINQIQSFTQLQHQLMLQIKYINMKLKDYIRNLIKYLQKYDEQLSYFKRIVKKQGSKQISLEMYKYVKMYINDCINIEDQIKVIRHYFKCQENKNNKKQIYTINQKQQTQQLQYINAINYRHSRFLEGQKKLIKQCYSNKDKLQKKQLPFSLIIDFVLLRQLYYQKMKFNETNQFKKLYFAYTNSYAQKDEFSTQFQTLKMTQLRKINQCKNKILQKLLEYPYQIQSQILTFIQTQQFTFTFSPIPIQKSVQIFIYLSQLRQNFLQIDSLNSQQHNYEIIFPQQQPINPIKIIQDNIQNFSNLLLSVVQIGEEKYHEIREALLQIVVDDDLQLMIGNYIESFDLVHYLAKKIEQSSLEGVQQLEFALESFMRKNLFQEMKQFIDRCQSIFYRLSKNIDCIQLQHLQNIFQVLDKPQSTAQFLKLLNSQCIFFLQKIDTITSNTQLKQIQTKLKQLLKKMEDSQYQIDFQWQDQIKLLQKQQKSPQNSLQKMLKLYQQHISKVSTQKTLQYKFVQHKKHQLSSQIKQFLQQSGPKKLQQGKQLCDKLKNYLDFLKSMKFKMIVNLNGIQDVRNLEGLQKIYERSVTKSQAARSHTDMAASQMKQNIMMLDYVHTPKDQDDRYSVNDVKTSHFHEQRQRIGSNKKSQLWMQKNSMYLNIEAPFGNINEDWTRRTSSHNEMKKMDQQRLQINGDVKSNFYQIINKTPINEISQSNVDNLKRYTINSNNNKRSQTKMSLKLPPQLSYDTQQNTQQIKYSSEELISKQLAQSQSQQSLRSNGNKSSRVMTKSKTKTQIQF